MILVTGAAGFVGRAVRAAIRTDSVVGVDLAPAVADDLVSNLSSPDAAAEIIQTLSNGERPSCVVHLAGVTPWSREPDYALDVAMADTVSDVCRQLRVPRLVYMSGWVVYDPAAPVPYTETTPLAPATAYGASKLAVEGRLAARAAATRVVNLRAASIYGRGQTAPGLIPNLVGAALRGAPLVLGARDTRRDYLHVDDVAKAVARLAASDLDAPVTALNLGSGRSISVAEVADAVSRAARELGLSPQVQDAPSTTPGAPPDNRLSIERARALGLLDEQVAFDEGIRDYMAWRRREGLL